MVIVLCCTRNWYIHLATVIYAILKHNKVKKIYLFIEDDDIPYLDYKEIEFININKTKEYITKDSPNYNTKYSKMSYIRCYFTKLLKCDKILYVDVDTLVTDNIEELWNIDLKDNVIIIYRVLDVLFKCYPNLAFSHKKGISLRKVMKKYHYDEYPTFSATEAKKDGMMNNIKFLSSDLKKKNSKDLTAVKNTN